jgi:hypothetical protein
VPTIQRNLPFPFSELTSEDGIASSSKTLVLICQTTWHHISEDDNLLQQVITTAIPYMIFPKRKVSKILTTSHHLDHHLINT